MPRAAEPKHILVLGASGKTGRRVGVPGPSGLAFGRPAVRLARVREWRPALDRVIGQVGHADSKMTMTSMRSCTSASNARTGWRSTRSSTGRASSSTEPRRRREPSPERGLGHEPSERANSETYESGSEVETPT